MKYGIIFDLDGLLVDTQLPFHATAESIILNRHWLDLEPKDISERYSGISTHEIFKELLPKQNADELVKEKWILMNELVDENLPVALEGMLEVCSFLKENSVPIIIASASPRVWIELCLKKSVSNPKDINSFGLNFADIFEDNYVSTEECEHGKPAPDIFLLAKKKLAIIDPLNTINWIVVGDGESDVYGGLAAHMEVLYLSKNNTSFNSFTEVRRFKESIELANYLRDLVIKTDRPEDKYYNFIKELLVEYGVYDETLTNKIAGAMSTLHPTPHHTCCGKPVVFVMHSKEFTCTRCNKKWQLTIEVKPKI